MASGWCLVVSGKSPPQATAAFSFQLRVSASGRSSCGTEGRRLRIGALKDAVPEEAGRQIAAIENAFVAYPLCADINYKRFVKAAGLSDVGRRWLSCGRLKLRARRLLRANAKVGPERSRRAFSCSALLTL
jgi:hypothetical protein